MPIKDEHLEEVGIETEEDVSASSADEIRHAVITGSDWTTETIVSQLRKGNINLDPRFQRREVWTPSRKSLLIESIILNLPVPQIVLAERNDEPNTFIVLDGKQRLLAIRQFCTDESDSRDEGFTPLTLSKLSQQHELNGESYSSLTASPDRVAIVNAFDNHTIRTVVIRNWPDSDYLHRVFLRLNTGSVRLSPQELRQALLPGGFTDFLDEFAMSSKELQSALGIDGPDFRMRDNEVFLRYMAFATGATTYSGNLKVFLDDTVRRLNDRWEEDEPSIRDEAAQCALAIAATIDIFGQRDSFSTFNGEAFEGRFNRAVFDVMTYYFRQPSIREAALNSDTATKKSFIALSKSDADFVQSLTTTTKSRTSTSTRFDLWAKALSEVVGVRVTPPEFTWREAG